MTKTIRSAIIHATPRQLEQIAQTPGVNLSYVTEGDNGTVVHHEAGPLILDQVSRCLDNPCPPTWDELDPGQQDALLSLAAGSTAWAADGDIDSHHIHQLMEDEPQLARKLNRRDSP